MSGLVGRLRSLVVYWRPGRQGGLRRMYRPFVGPGDLVFDIGAHLGDRTAAFAALGARVIAFEPQPEIRKWLEKMVGSDERVTIRREAVGRQVGTARLAISRDNPTLSTLAEDWRDSLPKANPSFRNVRWDDTVEVPVTTLDALIAAYGVPRFCKIDVEGFEAEVLAGLSQPVAGVSIEFVSGGVDVAVACLRRLEALGSYEFNAIPGERRKFVFERWQSGEQIERWLRAGADGASSGDIYARLTDGVR